MLSGAFSISVTRNVHGRRGKERHHAFPRAPPRESSVSYQRILESLQGRLGLEVAIEQ